MWGAIRVTDKLIGIVEKICKKEEFDITALDMPELSLVMTALPLFPEDRKLLINNVEFTA